MTTTDLAVRLAHIQHDMLAGYITSAEAAVMRAEVLAAYVRSQS